MICSLSDTKRAAPVTTKCMCRNNLSDFFSVKTLLFKTVRLYAEYCPIDTCQDFLIPEHMKPCMHILETSISSLNHFVVRPTKTPKSANKTCQFLTFKVIFLCQKLPESF